jgi:hypothetical protein
MEIHLNYRALRIKQEPNSSGTCRGTTQFKQDSSDGTVGGVAAAVPIVDFALSPIPGEIAILLFSLLFDCIYSKGAL